MVSFILNEGEVIPIYNQPRIFRLSRVGRLICSTTVQGSCARTYKFIAMQLFFLFFFYLFLATLSLRCCAWAFSSCGERGLLFVAVCGLLIAVASLVVEHGLQAHGLQQLWHAGFSSCGARAQLPRGMWVLPVSGLEPVSPALAGGFLTTAPPGKPCHVAFGGQCFCVAEQSLPP